MSSIPSNVKTRFPLLERVVVVGTSGSGKSTFARTLATKLGCPHIELDLIQWLPGWQEQDPAVFRAKVAEAAAAPRWVVDGNYARVRDLVWTRATTIIWLNYSFRIVFSRAVRRTAARVWKRDVILNGNRESIRKGFFSLDGIPAWVVRTYGAVKRDYSPLFSAGRYDGANMVVFERPRDAEQFLTEAFPAAADV